MDEPDWNRAERRQDRIEALRAASRVVAGMYADGKDILANNNSKTTAEAATIQIAEQFAKWLETGDLP